MAGEDPTGVAAGCGSQGFEGGFNEARPRMDEAVAGDRRFEHFLEALVVVGEDHGAQLCGVVGAGLGQARPFGQGTFGRLGGGQPGAHVVDHGTQAFNVLGQVAAPRSGFSLRGAEAVASFPGAQRRR